jgi:prophage antirepressor-like protein
VQFEVWLDGWDFVKHAAIYLKQACLKISTVRPNDVIRSAQFKMSHSLRSAADLLSRYNSCLLELAPTTPTFELELVESIPVEFFCKNCRLLVFEPCYNLRCMKRHGERTSLYCKGCINQCKGCTDCGEKFSKVDFESAPLIFSKFLENKISIKCLNCKSSMKMGKDLSVAVGHGKTECNSVVKKFIEYKDGSRTFNIRLMVSGEETLMNLSDLCAPLNLNWTEIWNSIRGQLQLRQHHWCFNNEQHMFVSVSIVQLLLPRFDYNSAAKRYTDWIASQLIPSLQKSEEQEEQEDHEEEEPEEEESKDMMEDVTSNTSSEEESSDEAVATKKTVISWIRIFLQRLYQDQSTRNSIIGKSHLEVQKFLLENLPPEQSQQFKLRVEMDRKHPLRPGKEDVFVRAISHHSVKYQFPRGVYKDELHFRV